MCCLWCPCIFFFSFFLFIPLPGSLLFSFPVVSFVQRWGLFYKMPQVVEVPGSFPHEHREMMGKCSCRHRPISCSTLWCHSYGSIPQNLQDIWNKEPSSCAPERMVEYCYWDDLGQCFLKWAMPPHEQGGMMRVAVVASFINHGLVGCFLFVLLQICSGHQIILLLQREQLVKCVWEPDI